LAYSEFVPHQIRDIERNIQFPIPQTKIMDPDIDTTILKVTHCIDIKIQSASKFSRPVKVQVPLVITGFPHLLFEDMRRSVDILPIYARNTEVVPAEVGDSDSSSEIEFGPAVPFQPDEDEIQVIPSVMNDSIAHSAHADVVTEGTIDLTTDRTEQDEESEESSQENEPFLNVSNRVVDLNLDESQPTSATETIRNLDYPLKIIDCHSETSSVVTAQNL
jgi:hypothetical protein